MQISQKQLESRIFTFRGVQVMIDRDLAEIYQVETRVLNQAVKRNLERFPEDFMFQLTDAEWDNLKSQNTVPSLSTQNSILKDEILKSQIVISRSHGGSRKLPYVFTEQGVASCPTPSRCSSPQVCMKFGFASCPAPSRCRTAVIGMKSQFRI